MLPLLLLPPPDPSDPHMTTASWLFLGIAWVFVSGLLIWSFRRVLRSGPPEP